MKIAIIPARGGSKRIPQKNIKNFCGKPIIGYAIETAIKSKLFDKVVVSTDCPDIAKVAESFGAEIPFFRKSSLADDFASTRDVMQDALDFYEKKINVDFLCCIYPTTPFLNSTELHLALKSLESDESKTACFSATEFHYSPFRGFFNEGKGPELVFPEHLTTRSQDLKPIYHDAGQFYWYKTDKDKLIGRVINSPNALIHIIPNYLVHDIDTNDDWVRAELFYNALAAI